MLFFTFPPKNRQSGPPLIYHTKSAIVAGIISSREYYGGDLENIRSDVDKLMDLVATLVARLPEEEQKNFVQDTLYGSKVCDPQGQILEE